MSNQECGICGAGVWGCNKCWQCGAPVNERTITIRFKTPYAVSDAVHEYCRETGKESDEEEEICRALSKKYFRSGEYVTIEVNVENGTCTVVPNKG